MIDGIKNMLLNSLGLQERDEVCVLSDLKHRNLANLILTACEELKIVCILLYERDSMIAMDNIKKYLLTPNKYNKIIFALSYSIWHLPERKMAKYNLKKQLVSIICDDKEFSSQACKVNIDEINIEYLVIQVKIILIVSVVCRK